MFGPYNNVVNSGASLSDTYGLYARWCDIEVNSELSITNNTIIILRLTI